MATAATSEIGSGPTGSQPRTLSTPHRALRFGLHLRRFRLLTRRSDPLLCSRILANTASLTISESKTWRAKRSCRFKSASSLRRVQETMFHRERRIDPTPSALNIQRGDASRGSAAWPRRPALEGGARKSLWVLRSSS